MKFCNIEFNLLYRTDLFKRGDDELKCISTVNAQFIVLANENRRYMDYINSHYATFDGEVPLKKARKMSPEFADAERLPGSEIVYDFAEYAKKESMRMFFLGGGEKSNAMAVAKIRDSYQIQIDGYSPDFESYPFSEQFTAACRERIAAFSPDIIFVGFGAPKQEFFIEDNFEFLKQCGVKFAVGSGGTFEFVSGLIRRAPRWMQNAGLEGLYRFFKQIGWMRFKRLLYSLKFYKYVGREPEWKNVMSESRKRDRRAKEAL